MVPIDKRLHLENYLKWFNDPEVTRWLLRNRPISRIAEEEFFERASTAQDDIYWAVHDETGRHIGATGLHGFDWPNRRARSGIAIGDKSVWGQGYGSEIMQVRTRWAFMELGLHRIESECFAANEASAKCLTKAGYRKVGVERKKYWRGGDWHDCIKWEILAEDWRADRMDD